MIDLPQNSVRPAGTKRHRLLLVAALLIGMMAIGAVVVKDIRWRAIVVARKCLGQLESIDWPDLIQMMRPGSPVKLAGLASRQTPYAIITNPFNTAHDQALGKDLFGQNCSQCHGVAAGGGAGPALVGRALKHGDTDWAMYHTISKGVPGTAMRAAPLGRDDIWRVMTYIRSLAGGAHTGAIAGDDSAAPDVGPIEETTAAALLDAGHDLADWRLHGGSYDGRRFSADGQINAANVGRLAVRWIHQFGTTEARIESVPIVVGRYLFVTLPAGPVLALDSATGRQIWRFDRPAPPDVGLCCINANRGVAVLGKKVYVATLDAHLLALDAETGKLLWDVVIADYHQGYSMTAAPMALGKYIITGVAGGDFATRGFVAAYDSETGAQRWRFKAIPEPGEPGHDSWAGDSWRTGGASTWGSGSFDPELGLLYWGIANAAPDFNASARAGDNLYTNSLVALDVATGRLVWYFQFTPGDDHDWDSIQTPALIDVNENGQSRKLIAVANRNGFFYVLDRKTGQFLRGEPFAKQTWALGLTPAGRPIRAPNSSPSVNGAFVYPSVTGATSWWPSTYDPQTQLYYVLALERGGLFFKTEEQPDPVPGKIFAGSNGQYVAGVPGYTAVRAIDPRTAKVVWEHRNAGYNDLPRGGLLSTAGGLIFGSDTSRLIAMDAKTGAVLWSFDAGGQISAAPISYRVDDRQIIAVSAGQLLISFELPESPH